MINEIKHFSYVYCHFNILFVKCPLESLLIFYRVIFFIDLWKFFVYLNTSPLSDVGFANMYFLNLWFAFHSLYGS